MSRRIIKPFTVEVRRGGRTVKGAPAGSGPSMADLIRDAEQPRIDSWPGIDQEPEGSLRALERPSAAIAPTGRVLPALNDLAPPAAVAEREPAPPTSQTVGGVRPEDDVVNGTPEAEVDRTAPAPDIDASPIAATTLPRQGRSRLPRDAFRREERWQARLPAAVHRTRKRGA